jgi:hypothetical protein
MSVKLISPIVNTLNINNIIKDILPTVINPLFVNGIVSLSFGLVLIIIYTIINMISKKKEKKEQEPKLVEEKLSPEQTATDITK